MPSRKAFGIQELRHVADAQGPKVHRQILGTWTNFLVCRELFVSPMDEAEC